MTSGTTSQDGAWKERGQSAETHYAKQREQEQLAALREKMMNESSGQSNNTSTTTSTTVPREDRPYEAGFGGQEDLEDRYATTSGEH